MLGEASIVYGHGPEALERCLRELEPSRVARAARAARALQERHDWRTLADATWGLLEELGTEKL
jgi:hypothetical protein